MTITVKADNVLDYAKRAIEQGKAELVDLLIRPHSQIQSPLARFGKARDELLLDCQDWFTSCVLINAVQDYLLDFDDVAFSYDEFVSEYLQEKLTQQFGVAKQQIQETVAVFAEQSVERVKADYTALVRAIAQNKLEPLFSRDRTTQRAQLAAFLLEQQKICSNANIAISNYEAKKVSDRNALKELWVATIKNDVSRTFLGIDSAENADALAENLLQLTPLPVQKLPHYCLLTLAMQCYYKQYARLSIPERTRGSALSSYITNVKTILGSANIDVYARTLNGFQPYEVAAQKFLDSAEIIVEKTHVAAGRVDPAGVTTRVLYSDTAVLNLLRQHIARLGQEGTLIAVSEEQEDKMRQIVGVALSIDELKKDREKGRAVFLTRFFSSDTSSDQGQLDLQLSLKSAAQASLIFNQTGDFELTLKFLNKTAALIYGLDDRTLKSRWNGGFFSKVIKIPGIESDLDTILTTAARKSGSDEQAQQDERPVQYTNLLPAAEEATIDFAQGVDNLLANRGKESSPSSAEQSTRQQAPDPSAGEKENCVIS